MLLIDTSLWVASYRDASGAAARSVQGAIGSEEFVFCQFIRAELLQGCRDEREWTDTREYLDDQSYLEMSPGGWTEAARIYFELRQRGFTVRSTLDCCVAVVALEHDLTLLHTDRDFENHRHCAALEAPARAAHADRARVTE
jgi:predicted nucleic acid-binding protein